MSLQRIQTCEYCGEQRSLTESDKPETGGWRSLNAGALEATFCNNCVRQLVQQARAAAAQRAESEALQ